MPELRNLLITLLLFSAVIIGISNFSADLAKKYGVTIQDVSGMSSIEKIQNETKDLEQTLRSSQITGTFLDVPLTVLSGAYQVFKLILVSFTEIWSGFMHSVARYLFLPEWFISVVIAVVAITIIFEIISVISKYKV